VDADTVVELAFDGRSFRSRKVGREHDQTRDLSEIEEVVPRIRRKGPGYRVIFRDGARAELWFRPKSPLSMSGK